MVSRMPNRSVTGAAHKETVMMWGGVDEKTGKTIVVKRVPLEEIKFDKDGNFPMLNKKTDMATYNAIRDRYLSSGKDVKNAFKQPLYKPSKSGRRNPIRRVKVEVDKRSYVREVNGGIAQNGDLVRVDLFIKDGKYHMIPIYVMDISLPNLPDRIVTSSKGYNKWKKLDDSYQFHFSLYPFDLVRMKIKDEDRFLYFSTIDIDSNRIILKEPNFPHEQNDRRYSLGRIDLLEKYQIDILGGLFLVKHETRQFFNGRKFKINASNFIQ